MSVRIWIRRYWMIVCKCVRRVFAKLGNYAVCRERLLLHISTRLPRTAQQFLTVDTSCYAARNGGKFALNICSVHSRLHISPQTNIENGTMSNPVFQIAKKGSNATKRDAFLWTGGATDTSTAKIIRTRWDVPSARVSGLLSWHTLTIGDANQLKNVGFGFDYESQFLNVWCIVNNL